MGLVRDRDVLSGAVLAALGVFILTQALQWSYLGPDGPGPGFFPVWYGLLMVVLSLGLVLRAAIRPDPEARSAVDWRGTGRALLTWAMFAVAIALMVPLGFLASFGMLTFAVVCVVMGKPVLAGLATAFGAAAGFWLVFGLALGLNLPTGQVWAPLLRTIGIG